VISPAIVLHECGLLHRAQTYATDISESDLKTARLRDYPLDNVRSCEAGHLHSGGGGVNGYVTSGDRARFERVLVTNLTWARHNLVMDASLSEFHVISRTGRLGRYTSGLRRRMQRLLHDSLIPGGHLILAASQPEVAGRRDDYEWVIGQPGIFRRALP
jgi:chemotaxis protein methyltransferase CheR